MKIEIGKCHRESWGEDGTPGAGAFRVDSEVGPY